MRNFTNEPFYKENSRVLKDCPFISVIVTVFDSGQYLDSCLKSLANQKLKNIEIVIINDCSPDPKDERISQKYVNSDKRFSYLKNNKNEGTGFSREKAIKYCKGKYIGFLDADDYVSKDAFEVLYREASAHDADIVVANYHKVYKHDYNNLEVGNSEYNKYITTGKNLLTSQLNRRTVPYYLRVDWWNKIYRRNLFIQNNITFPHVVRNEGTASMIMSLLANRCVIIDKPVFYTYVRANSVCRTYRIKNIDDCIESTLHFREWLIKQGVFEQFRLVYLRFFYFVIFNHNLQLISALSKEERNKNIKILLDKINQNSIVKLEFFEYLTLDEKSIERLVMATINNNMKWSMISKIKKSDFFYREEGGARLKNFHAPTSYQKKVSIITVVKDLVSSNRTEFFFRMLKSIKTQDYNYLDIEHIIIDAGSKDGTVEFLKELEKQYKIDYWVSEVDTGIYNAMNKGLSYTTGNYFLFLNSDDFLCETAIKKLVQTIELEKTDYAFSNAWKVDDNEKKVGKHIGNLSKIYFGTPYCHQTLMCKRHCFDKVSFDEKYKITMWTYSLDLHLSNFQASYIDDYLAYFRVGGLSTGVDTSEKFHKEQTYIKQNHIVKNLNINIEEYEHLNRTMRKWDLGNSNMNVEKIVKKLSSHSNSFQKDFNKRLWDIIEVTHSDEGCRLESKL